jgi:uncharacterized protein YjbJ (UPF0337 family)
MDWERIKGNWQHYKVLARLRWTRITSDEFDIIDGQLEVLAGQISQVYGVSNDAAHLQIASWQGQQQEPEPGPARAA